MPSKQIYLIFFLLTSAVFVAAQLFVFRQLAKMMRRDFPTQAERVLRIMKWVFILMNIPLIFLFFRKQIVYDTTLLSQILLYPYTIWQFLILMWAVILMPIVIVRIIRNRLQSKVH